MSRNRGAEDRLIGNPAIDGAGERFTGFLDAVYCNLPVGGLTHNFYRYPARFSPQFARKAIETFTRPGDVVLDPFMGGGTTLVEALSLGRRCIGADINPLSGFLARTKTTPLTKSDCAALFRWASDLVDTINLHIRNKKHLEWESYQRNMPWWLRKTLEVALDSTQHLQDSKQRQFARCSLLRTAQWALDCRSRVPSKAEFLTAHQKNLDSMLQGALAFSSRLRESFGKPARHASRSRRILIKEAAHIHSDRRLPKSWLPPKLVLTSPPYFSVHIRYHRWQVEGRRETPAPYWLAGCRDGHGEAYYTFGDRKKKDLDLYLKFLRESFASIATMLDRSSIVVQLVGFSDPASQIRPYLNVMREVGLEEFDLQAFGSSFGRIWRDVPNRKWYVSLNGNLSTKKEILLIHRKAAT